MQLDIPVRTYSRRLVNDSSGGDNDLLTTGVDYCADARPTSEAYHAVFDSGTEDKKIGIYFLFVPVDL